MLDRRSGDPLQISAKTNGYGMEMAAIVATRPISEIVRDALTTELQQRGFQVGSSSLIINVEVIRFRSNYEVGFFSADAKSEATIAVQVRSPQGAIL